MVPNFSDPPKYFKMESPLLIPGLEKKIVKIGQKHAEVMMWKRSIINHMYYVAARAPAESREATLKDMWLSVDNHIHDVHEHQSQIFTYCDHIHLIYDRGKEWLVRGKTHYPMILFAQKFYAKMKIIWFMTISNLAQKL